MHNRGNRNKRSRSRNPLLATQRGPQKVDSVKDILSRLSPTLTRVTNQAARQATWRDWIQDNLPSEITAKISGIVEREGMVVLFAESAAWSARLRYAVLEIEGRLRDAHPNIKEVKVRVLPRSAGRT